MIEIPAVPPPYSIKITRYVDGDLRKAPERLQAAVQIAQAYHDDWDPMVQAANVARHENTLAIPVARMVLNWARTQPEWTNWLTQLEWDLLDHTEREAKVIDIEERAQRRELYRREAEEKAANERSRFVRTSVKVKLPLLVARQNGKVIHRVNPHGRHQCDWRNHVWGKRGEPSGFFDELGMAWPPSTLHVETICKASTIGYADPLLYSYENRPDLPICKSGCWNVREDR